jgi:adenosyl cobinamide kinase/adenosyl cobinamide phosphate guanylyltransferase
MHFVTGGAFNGKREWAFAHYGQRREEVKWVSSFQENKPKLNMDILTGEHPLLFIEGVEYYIGALREHSSPREEWNQILVWLKSWEDAIDRRQVVVIGSDITRGVVPMSKEERVWRDLVGWCYQDLVRVSERVDVIWYGINQRIK